MTKRLLLILFTMLTLQGCVGAAFVAGAATGGIVVNDRRSVTVIVDDQNIKQQATIALNANREIASECHIVVASFNRVVLLAGQAPTPELRQEIVRIVQGVAKVKRIYNEISVRGPTANMTRSSDAWVTSKVKGEMLLTKGLHSAQIKVVTENGSVYLMGLVTPKQGRLAAASARRVNGVQRVIKLFEYLSVVN